MAWSLKLGEVKGTGVYVHATFALLLIWAAMSAWAEQHSLAAVADRTALLLIVFAIVVLHELGHVTAGRLFGVRTRDITLLPIGGVARMERIPKIPAQELVIALAGPAVNLVLAVAIFAMLRLVGSPAFTLDETTIMQGSMAQRLLVVNVSLLLFNMLPAFPMDGGRAFRAILAMRMNYARATQVAAKLGQLMAMGFAVLGFMANPMLVLIALFIWVSAAAEAQMAVRTEALEGVVARQAMMTEFLTLEPGDPLRLAAAMVLSGAQRDLPVVESGHPVGILTRDRLLEALKTTPASRVGDVMSKEFPVARAEDLLTDVMTKLSEPGGRVIAVVEFDRLVGLLTAENLEYFLLFHGLAGERQERQATIPAVR